MKLTKQLLLPILLTFVFVGCSSSTEFTLGDVKIKSGTYVRYHKGKLKHPYKLEIHSDSTVRLTQLTNISSVGKIRVDDGELRIHTEKPLFHIWQIIKSDDNGFYDHFNDDQWVLQ